MKPHKWAKEIKAWADGAEIESRQKYHSYDEFDEWELNKNPAWIDDIRFEYRIKPQPKEPQPHRLLWGGGVEPIIKKPHEVSEQYGKAMQQAYEDGFVQGKLYAETGRVSDGKTIPKEPQYLYAYAGWGIVEFHEEEASCWDVQRGDKMISIPYVGKIKLETDDE